MHEPWSTVPSQGVGKGVAERPDRPAISPARAHLDVSPIGGELADEGDVEVERLDDVPAHRLIEDLARQPRIAGGERIEREVAALAFGDVVAVADVADEGAIRIAARVALVGDPPITAIDMAQAVLHAEGFAIREGLCQVPRQASRSSG